MYNVHNYTKLQYYMYTVLSAIQQCHVLVVQSLYVHVQLHIHTCAYIVHTSGIHVSTYVQYHSAHACSCK